jgi:heterotetrameric sarcosine oxidase gamma subunit
MLTSTLKGVGSVFEGRPIARGIVPEEVRLGALTLSDLSLTPKWRVFAGYEGLRPGTARRDDDVLVWSVGPGEWTVLGSRPQTETVVDLTYVRALFRLTGARSRDLMTRLCALDLGDHMFGDGAAARTLFAEVATELVRDDQEGVPSYLIVPSRSFGGYVHATVVEAGSEFASAG